ncbi:UNVERIFIED_CONTAM: hypothetical protein HDU68_007554 [Siphonaria sp. JEL0065]|nr:hypothetical protein HDU68_007554 [Siphonaria sp. JEL0065]
MATAAPIDPAQFQPKTHVSSIKLALTQDIFNEVSNLITPIAHTFAMDMKIEDQHITKALPLLGETEVATATNVTIDKFDIKDVIMEIDDGYIAIRIENVDFLVSMDMKALGGDLGRVNVKADVDISAKLKFGLNGIHCTTDVYDIKSSLTNFDVKIGSGFTGDVISYAMDLVEYALKGTIESTLESTITSSLEQGLDSVLVRNWDVMGNVSSVFYKLAVEFVAVPVITKERGVEYLIGVDSFWKKDGPFVTEEPKQIAKDISATNPIPEAEKLTVKEE